MRATQLTLTLGLVLLLASPLAAQPLLPELFQQEPPPEEVKPIEDSGESSPPDVPPEEVLPLEERGVDADAQTLTDELLVLEDSLTELARELEAAQPQLPPTRETREREAFEELVTTGQAPVLARPTGVVYPFGEAVPELVCAPERACDLELEAGEVVDGVALGATDRWEVTQFFEGEGEGLKPHILLKPAGFDLATNLVVVTNRRTYHLELASIAEEGKDGTFHHHVSFWYPQSWAERLRSEEEAKETPPVPAETGIEPRLDPAALNFAYGLHAPHRKRRRLPWRPVAVFDDGERVFIRLPPEARPLPAVVGLDSGGEPFPLNEQFRDGAFVIPTLVPEIELVSGSGKRRRSLRIERLGPGGG